MDETSEAFHDSIALARAIGSNDILGAEAIVAGKNIEELLNLPVALSWLLTAAVNRLAILESVDSNLIWLTLIGLVEEGERNNGSNTED